MVPPLRTFVFVMFSVPWGSRKPQSPLVSLQMLLAAQTVEVVAHHWSVAILERWSAEQAYAAVHAPVKVTRLQSVQPIASSPHEYPLMVPKPTLTPYEVEAQVPVF